MCWCVCVCVCVWCGGVHLINSFVVYMYMYSPVCTVIGDCQSQLPHVHVLVLSVIDSYMWVIA